MKNPNKETSVTFRLTLRQKLTLYKAAFAKGVTPSALLQRYIDTLEEKAK